MPEHDKWMHMALDLAQQAAAEGEVPVGAVIVDDTDNLVAIGYNQKEKQNDCTQHAEVVAIREACRQRTSWRLSGCTLYVTLEPCLMCAGAIYQARMSAVHFGAADPKAGACGSLYEVHQDARLNHRFEVVQHPKAGEQSAAMLRQFFRNRR